MAMRLVASLLVIASEEAGALHAFAVLTRGFTRSETCISDNDNPSHSPPMRMLASARGGMTKMLFDPNQPAQQGMDGTRIYPNQGGERVIRKKKRPKQNTWPPPR